MNAELKKLHKWFIASKLSLNVKKTNYCLFHKKRQLTPQDLPMLLVGGEEVNRQSSIKFLGIVIDENLQWNCHIKSIKSKLSKSVGILYKSHKFLTKNTLRMLYFAFVHPYLTYANIVWASTSHSKLKSLFSKQKRACQLISKSNYSKTLNGNPMEKLNILNVYEINILQNLTFMSKWHSKKLPQSFKNSFTKPRHRFYTRKSKYSLLNS